MICTGNLILRTMMLEYFNNSLYFKSYMSFLSKIRILSRYKKKSAENGHFQFRGFGPPSNQNLLYKSLILETGSYPSFFFVDYSA